MILFMLNRPTAPSSIFPFMAHLLFVGSPLAVHWPTVCFALVAFTAAIMTIVVFTVDAIFWRTGWHWTHITNKGWKTISPTTAHLNASSAVILIRDIGWSIASAFSAGPRIPLRLTPKSMLPSDTVKVAVLPLLKQSRRGYFILETSAAFTVAEFESPSVDWLLCTAITAAPPTPLLFRSVKNSQNGPASESLPGKISNKNRHDTPPGSVPGLVSVATRPGNRASGDHPYATQ